MALEASSATNESFCSEKPVCVIWGCQLNKENPVYTFDTPEEWSCEQQLALRTICLGENAKDEFHVVEIMPPKSSNISTPVRIATLKLSILPMATLAGLDLTPPITFRLKSGSGPVYLAGQHVTVGLQWNGDGDQERESSSSSSQQSYDSESSSTEDSPVKPVKHSSSKRVPSTKKGQEPPVPEPTLTKKGNRGRKPTAKAELRLQIPTEGTVREAIRKYNMHLPLLLLLPRNLNLTSKISWQDLNDKMETLQWRKKNAINQ